MVLFCMNYQQRKSGLRVESLYMLYGALLTPRSLVFGGVTEVILQEPKSLSIFDVCKQICKASNRDSRSPDLRVANQLHVYVMSPVRMTESGNTILVNPI